VWFKKKETEQERFNRHYQTIMRDGKIMSVAYLLQRAANRVPNNIALLYQQQAITYRQLYAMAVKLSKKLQSMGIKPRDRVITMIENSPEYYVAYFAALQLGAVIAPLNTFLKEREAAHIVENAQPSLIIVSSSLRALFNGVSGVPILTEQDIDLTASAHEPLPDFAIVGLEPDEMIALLYTSGTTGFPKGVMLSSKNIMTNVIQGITRFELNHNDRMFAALPLFHSFPQNSCVWVALFVGATVILIHKVDRRYIVEGLGHKPTVFVGVPALYGFLCLLKTAPLDSVRCFVSGGDALPDKIRAGFALLYRRTICSGYGLTETAPMLSGDLDDVAAPTSSAGRPLVGVACSVRDEQGNEVAHGDIGQLWVKGDNVMLGYYKEPAMTAEVLKDGWFATGDLVYLDHEGRIIITGRAKDLIINKGVNIYPQEIENIIMLHPNVLRVGVVGLAEAEVGEVPVAFVQVREVQAGIEKELRSLCLKNLAAYKVPRDFICSADNLPMTATGKVDKKKLREEVKKSVK
jgi:long-chain acyl-CoA synthetase